MSKPLVIYHGNCTDGFGAAWSIWTKYPDWEFYAGTYQRPPPDVTDREVYIVDFSYKKPVILEMLEKAKSITILDHHKSAIKELGELMHKGLIKGVFDLGRSGAMITWGYFHSDLTPPRLLEHIQDRDLHRYAIPYTTEIQAALFSYPYEFTIWEFLMTLDVKEFISDGIAINRKQQKDVKELLESVVRSFTIGGYTVPTANAPKMYASDVATELAKGADFGAAYYDTNEGRIFSLRSTSKGVDVSTVAECYGGGGHKHASGFKVEVGDETIIYDSRA